MNNRMYEKEELYNLSLSNIHKYSLLNEIFAIRDERFPKEQQATMLCVNGYISIASLDIYKRNIDELVTYQNIGTIKEFKELQQENKQLKEKLNKILKENAEHNDKVVDKVNWENMLLKRNCNIGNENLTFYRNQYNQLENIRKEAIEYIKENIDSCNSALSNPEYTIISKHNLLKNEKKMCNELLSILERK